MTLDMAFWYEGEKYYLVYEYGEYRIVDHDWNRVAGNPNMLTLLTDPIEAWGNHSFKELIEQLEFED